MEALYPQRSQTKEHELLLEIQENTESQEKEIRLYLENLSVANLDIEKVFPEGGFYCELVLKNKDKILEYLSRGNIKIIINEKLKKFVSVPLIDIEIIEGLLLHAADKGVFDGTDDIWQYSDELTQLVGINSNRTILKGILENNFFKFYLLEGVFPIILDYGSMKGAGRGLYLNGESLSGAKIPKGILVNSRISSNILNTLKHEMVHAVNSSVFFTEFDSDLSQFYAQRLVDEFTAYLEGGSYGDTSVDFFERSFMYYKDEYKKEIQELREKKNKRDYGEEESLELEGEVTKEEKKLAGLESDPFRNQIKIISSIWHRLFNFCASNSFEIDNIKDKITQYLLRNVRTLEDLRIDRIDQRQKFVGEVFESELDRLKLGGLLNEIMNEIA